MRLITFIITILSCIYTNGQTSYAGFIGKSPITLIAHYYSDGDTRAYYVYDKYDTPIIINGRWTPDALKLYEKNDKGGEQATLVFPNFKEESSTIEGKWISADSSKIYDISLQKDFDISRSNLATEQQGIIQPNSTKNHYFKVLTEEDNVRARISGVKIFEKRTDRLIQTIELDCEILRADNTAIGDYNFDGLQDFSVFEDSYAGPNTSSIYILRVPNSEKYMVSDFVGISLEFDQKSKLIYGYDQCCGGRMQTETTYKVIDNKMVLIAKRCLEYDDEKQDLITIDCE